MLGTIIVRGLSATLTDEGWISEDDRLARLLNDSFPFPPIPEGIIESYVPDPVSHFVSFVGEFLKAEKVELPKPAETEEDAIY